MAALVRHDTAIEAVFPRVAAEIQADATEIGRLYDALDCVKESDNPRTAHLLACSRTKIAQKLIEEAGETALAAVRHRSRSVVRESADLLYHLIVLWHECGITPDEVWAEMRSRADKLGMAENCRNGPAATRRHPSAANEGGNNVLHHRIHCTAAPERRPRPSPYGSHQRRARHDPAR